MKVTRVGAREARSSFSELLGRVRYGDEVVIVERSGKPMAAMIPVEVYEREVAASQGQPAEVSPLVVSEGREGGRKLADPMAMLPLIVERIVRGFQP